MIEDSPANDRQDKLKLLKDRLSLEPSLLDLLGHCLRDGLSQPTTSGCFYSALPEKTDGLAYGLQQWPVWAKPVHIDNEQYDHGALARIGDNNSETHPEFLDVFDDRPKSTMRMCVLLEVMNFLHKFGEEEASNTPSGAVRRLRAVEAAFPHATQFLMAAWEGYLLIARNVLAEALGEVNAPVDWSAIKSEDMPWLYIERTDGKKHRERFFVKGAVLDWGRFSGTRKTKHEEGAKDEEKPDSRDEFLVPLQPKDILFVEPRCAKWEYQIVALFDHLKHPSNDWPILLKKLPSTGMRVGDLGLQRSRDFGISPSEKNNNSTSYFRLGGLLAAMGIDARLRRNWPSIASSPPKNIQDLIGKLKLWKANAGNTAVAKESDMTSDDHKHAHVPIAKAQVVALEQHAAKPKRGGVRLAGSTAVETESIAIDMDAELLKRNPDDDGSEDDGMLRVTDCAANRWRDWQGGDAMRYLSGYCVRAVIVLRDSRTWQIRGEPVAGMCVDWSLDDETGAAQFDVIPYWPQASGLAEQVRSRDVNLSAEMLDLSAKMGHRYYVLWIEVRGLSFPA